MLRAAKRQTWHLDQIEEDAILADGGTRADVKAANLRKKRQTIARLQRAVDQLA